MKIYFTYRIIVISIVILLYGICFIPVSITQIANLDNERSQKTINGQILFAPIVSRITYLIDNTGLVTHTWSSSYMPGVAVWWLGDGKILRTIKVGASGSGGSGGGVQIIQWDGTVIWDYRYNTNGYLSHHDVKSLPNGNVLLIAWETKTRNEAIAAGRNPNSHSG